ncbi:sterile alpha motif domain-containing protein 9-like [Diadema antillarum]|uniref:sterile alpha motif domain-containing protein 9-like n=1 Tax=Diadema antillarum TaxID=105358 RepID=UPI003A8913F6
MPKKRSRKNKSGNSNQGSASTGRRSRTGRAEDGAEGGHEAGPAPKPTAGSEDGGGIVGSREVEGAELLAPVEFELGFPADLEAIEVTEIALWKISECITHEQFTQFALSAGCSASSIRYRQSEMAKGVSIEEVAFKVLHAWDQNQVKGQAHFLFDIMVQKLRIDRDKFLSMFEEENFLLESERSRTMEGRQLWDVAENVLIEKYIPVGLRLGLTYNSLQSAREGTKTVDALFASLWKWQQGLSSNVDQPETLARVLDACQLRKVGNTVRHNHLSVINEGKTMVFVPSQPPPQVNPAEQKDIQLLVSHNNPEIQKKAEGNVKSVLLPTPDSLQPQGGELGESFWQVMRALGDWLKHTADRIRAIQKAVGRPAMYQPTGFTLDSIHLSVRVYSDEGYTLLIDDIRNGLIGRQLGDALIPPDARQGLPDNISFDVTLQEKGGEDATQVTHQSSSQKGSNVDAGRMASPLTDDVGPSHGQRKEESQVLEMVLSDVHPPTAAGPVVHPSQHGSPSLESKTEQAQEVHDVEEMAIVAVSATADKKGTIHAAIERGSQVLTKMEDWNEEDVSKWLKTSVGISDVKAFDGVDGYMLVRYKKDDLIDDFNLTPVQCRRILYKREDTLQREKDHEMTPSANDSPVSVSTQMAKPSSPPVASPRNLGEEVDTGLQQGIPALIHTQSSPAQIPSELSDGSAEIKPEIVELTQPAPVEENNSVGREDSGFAEKQDIGSQDSSPMPSGKADLASRETLSATQADTKQKLAKLLLGTDSGELDSSYYPVLVMNTPGTELKTKCKAKLDFISAVKWNVVFDCDPDSNNTGLCHFVNDRVSIKILQPHEFARTKDTDILREEIDFPEVPVWVFANGRLDGVEKEEVKLDNIDWIREHSSAILSTVRFFSDPGVIPPGRAVVIFLLLSDADIVVMSHIFREFYTSESFKSLGHFTVIAESEDLIQEWINHLERENLVTSSDMKQRCLSGIPWEEVSSCMLQLLGSSEMCLPELPMAPKGSCPLMKKHQSQWSDISVLARNECENTSMNESDPNFEEFAQRKEAQFYQGHEVDWWNFYLTEKKLNKGRGFNQVLQRECYKELHGYLQKKLASTYGKKVDNISMLTIFHEPGAGGTTVAKNLLWDFHCQHRCAIVRRITNDTVRQIMAFRQYGYEHSSDAGPVVLFLDNVDSENMRPFLLGLERETRYIQNDGLVFALIYCKQANDPEKLCEIEDNVCCFPLQHKLTEAERLWFVQKTEDLEKRRIFSEKESPELLLAFMVMKTECDPEYLKKVVQGILPNITENSPKELESAVNLLKYIAAVQSYHPDFAMPVSACDGFMQKQHRTSLSGGRHQTYTYQPWEKHKPKFMDLLLIEEYIQDIDGCVKGLGIVHPIIAKEVVNQLSDRFGQTRADMILELIEQSSILDTHSYSKRYIQKVCRDLMVRRKKKEYGDDVETDFAPFIEDVYRDNPAQAFRIMEVGMKKFKDPFIAQQKARLHSRREDDPEKAEEAINEALGLMDNNSYIWDTKGIILRQKMKKYDRIEGDEHITDEEMKDLLAVFNDACAAFQKAQRVMEAETSRGNYAGFVNEIDTIFKFLEIVQKRVIPFSQGTSGMEQLRRYLTTEYVPPELKLPSLRDHSDTVKELSDRVDKALDRSTDFLVQCAQQRFETKQYRILDKKLEQIYEKRIHFFAQKPRSLETAPYSHETVFAMRRSEIKHMKADGYQRIFEMASKKQVQDLKHARDLLKKNLGKPSIFDVKNFVFVSFALLVFYDEDFNENEMQHYVDILKAKEERTGGFFGVFFEMLLNWPARTTRETKPIQETMKELNNRWSERYINKRSEEFHHNIRSRSRLRQKPQPMKPTTEFYLGMSTPGKLVHRKAIGRISYSIWKEKFVTQNLARLEGTIENKFCVIYKHKASGPVRIQLSLPIKGMPSQERVKFYLGFSFRGPLAYDVTYKDRETRFIAGESRISYPSYFNNIGDPD